MAIEHAASAEVVNLAALDAQAEEPCAILKADDVELMWLVLPTGKHVPSHGVSSSMILQCLRGCVEVQLAGSVKVLVANQLMYLAGGVLHGLNALEDSRLLMTIVLPAERID